MAKTNDTSMPSGTDRTTARESMRLSLREEDDYDLAAMGISDGFRSTTRASASHNRVSSYSSHRERRSTPPPRPSSATKPRNLDIFALRHDGVTGVSNRPITVASSSRADSITRSSSVSAGVQVIRAESPYQGPVGPSHPYHMYPQNTRLARTASIATTSSNLGLSERRYTGQHEPTHPYGMYPQNTVPETEGIHDSIPVSSIPVGFPGLGGEYRRRLGPDGEEAADIIGPLGHTEQLPPYTKYPVGASTRRAAPGVPDISGAGGIGLATRDPEFASTDDLHSPLSRQSNHSVTSDSDHQINVAAFAALEKPPYKKWKIIARKKVWGIVPIWVFVLVALVFLGFIVILSVVLKIFLHHISSTLNNSQGPPSATMYTTVTTTDNVQSLSTVPTGIPDLPTGTYSLPVASPIATPSQQTCLDSDFTSAWSCSLSTESLNVTIRSTSTGYYKISIGSNDLPNTYFYGAQPPVIPSQHQLYLVNDTQQPQLGPAWYFRVLYDKVVVTPENSLPRDVKRNMERHSHDKEVFNRRSVAQAGENPWFCYWNNTVLEAFIYVNQTSELGAQEASASATSTLVASTLYPEPTKTNTAHSTPISAMGYSVLNLLAGYPKVIKIEESRAPSVASLPYCMKMEIEFDGSVRAVLHDDGSPIVIHLNETEPSLRFPSVKRSLSDNIFMRYTELAQRDTLRICDCQWLFS